MTTTKRDQFEAVLRALNDAFSRDAAAMHAMICNRVPCNEALADHPTVQVQTSMVGLTGFDISALGLINGVLGAAELPPVAAMVSDPAPDGSRRLLGFCGYEPMGVST